jgi:hypothetical protein
MTLPDHLAAQFRLDALASTPTVYDNVIAELLPNRDLGVTGIIEPVENGS